MPRHKPASMRSSLQPSACSALRAVGASGASGLTSLLFFNSGAVSDTVRRLFGKVLPPFRLRKPAYVSVVSSVLHRLSPVS